eukprot:9475495-Ditylum_brightwellii.AAC.1
MGHPGTGQVVARRYICCVPSLSVLWKYLVLAGITTVLCLCFLGFTFVASGVGTVKQPKTGKITKHTHPYQA